MPKSVKLPDDVYEKLKKISEQTNVPMGEVVDAVLQGEDAPVIPRNEKVTAKDAKEFTELTGFAGQLVQLISAIKDMNSPTKSVEDLVNSYRAIGVMQELFGGRGKNEYVDKFLDFLLSNPGIQALVSQIIMKGLGGTLGLDNTTNLVTPQTYRPQSTYTPPVTPPMTSNSQNNGLGLSIDDLYNVANESVEEDVEDESEDLFEDDEGEEQPEPRAPSQPRQVSISPQQLGAMVRQAVESGNDEVIRAIITGAVGDNPQAVNMLMGLLAQARQRAQR